MTDVNVIHNRVKNWLIDSNRFTIEESQDKDSYFVFSINRTDQISQIVPVNLSFPKNPIKELEYILLTLRWDINTNSGMMSAILNNPQMTNKFVIILKNKLDLTKYKLEILPDEKDIKSIIIFRNLPVITLQRDYLIDEIINLWSQYDRYSLAINLCFGMSVLAKPENYR